MFHIVNGGCLTRHPQSFSIDRPFGFRHYVLLCIHTEAALSINDIEYSVIPNSFLLIKPNTPYSYHNPNGYYMDDWLHFQCEPQDLASFPEKIFNIPFSCNNPSLIGTYIQQILWESDYAPATLKEENVNKIFEIILKYASHDFFDIRSHYYNPYRFSFQNQRIMMQSTPYYDHKASEKAKELGISLSYYEHLYKDFFGVSFRSDLIAMRISYAKSLISGSSLTFEQIAQECGYKNEVHFYRQFLSKTGITPGEYRKNRGCK